MLKKIKESIKRIKMKDILSIITFLIVIMPSLFLKLIKKIQKKEIWIVTESENTARDNAYHFYKYLKTKHPEVNSYYIINKKAKEYENVKKYGNIIQYGSLKHWIYYIASEKKISSQKGSNPSPALFYVLHVYFNLFNNRIYLKHGIIKDEADWWHFKNTKYKIIICGARDEYNFIKEKFGYPENSVQYTGLARFDNLHDNKINKKQILIIPTWRNWLVKEIKKYQKPEEFKNTNYFKNWQLLLENEQLINFLEKNSIDAYFYPHINMKKFINLFTIKTKRIKIINDEIDIQILLKESALMITDYSSVYMDFAYMKKPVIYYQFDKNEYREKQYKEGYFNYEKNGFGEVITNSEELVNKIEKYVENDYNVEEIYNKRMKDFFELHDNNNCERIYKAICNI